MYEHKPVPLSPNERAELASINAHPGLDVLKKILNKHCEQALLAVLAVEPDDDHRLAKLDALSMSAYAMKKFYELMLKELDLNYRILMQQTEETNERA